MIEDPKITKCPLCDKSLLADISYVNESGSLVAVENICLDDLDKYSQLSHAHLWTLYCPDHRITLKP